MERIIVILTIAWTVFLIVMLLRITWAVERIAHAQEYAAGLDPDERIRRIARDERRMMIESERRQRARDRNAKADPE